MWLAAGYFDESADGVEERCYTVAGYVSFQIYTAHLDLRWRALLSHWRMKYFKASELEYGMGEFRQYRDDPNHLSKPLSKREKDLIVEIKTSFIDAICQEDELKGYGCALVVGDLYKLKELRPELFAVLPPPYILCSHLLLVQIGHELDSWNKAEKYDQECTLIRPIFDSHDVWEPIMRGGFETFRKKNPETSRALLDPIYENDQDYLSLQAADCLAFEARRLAESHISESPKLRKAMERMAKHVRQIFYLDYEALVTLGEWQSSSDMIPVSPVIDNTRRPSRANRAHP